MGMGGQMGETHYADHWDVLLWLVKYPFIFIRYGNGQQIMLITLVYSCHQNIFDGFQLFWQLNFRRKLTAPKFDSESHFPTFHLNLLGGAFIFSLNADLLS